MRITVARYQCVIGVDLIVESRTDGNVPSRHYHAKTHIQGVQICVQHSSFNEFVVVNFTPLKIQEVRRFLLHERTAEISTILPELKRRTLGGAGSERIARVKTFVLEIEERAAADLVSAGPGQYIYSPGGLIIFCCERILINAYLADRLLRRQAATGKTVDENLPAVWSH